MLVCTSLRESMAKRINSFLDGYEDGQSCVLTVPWLDSLGEPLRLVVSLNDNSARVDDDGAIFFAIGRLSVLSETQRHSVEQFVEEFLSMHGLSWNKDDRVVEMKLDPEPLPTTLLYFAQTIGGCMSALPVITAQSLEKGSEGRSLGPRLATKLSREIEAWVKQYQGPHRRDILRRVKRRHPVEGAANPNWKVDFFYEPLLRIPTQLQEPPVVLITVDLGVKEPLFKAEHAVTMCRDIALKDRGYAVRLAFSGDGRNGESHVAREIIKTLSKDTYYPYDLDDSGVNTRFSNLLKSEIVGEPWL